MSNLWSDLSSVSTAQPHTVCNIQSVCLTVLVKFVPHAIVGLNVLDGVVVCI